MASNSVWEGINDMSTLVGHFVLSPREREKRDRRDSRGDEREGQGRKRNSNVVLRFYGPVNPMGSCRARSVYLTARLLGRLSPLSG